MADTIRAIKITLPPEMLNPFYTLKSPDKKGVIVSELMYSIGQINCDQSEHGKVEKSIKNVVKQ